VRVVVSPKVSSTAKWFPILDALLLIIGAQRHSFGVPEVSTLLQSDWCNTRGRDVREIIERSCVVASKDPYRDATSVLIDSEVRRGGESDLASKLTRVHPADAIFLLSQPFSLIVENEEYDGAFLFWMAKALGFDRLIKAYREGFFVFRHAGGKDSIPRSARVYCRGVWARDDGSHWRDLKLWLAAMLDNDARFPGDSPNAEIVSETQKHVGFVHLLRRRSIESYLPAAKLRKLDQAPDFLAKVDALESLTEDQRTHYHMKRGFRGEKGVILSFAEFLGSPLVPAEVKALYSSIQANSWGPLSDGFGKRLSDIFIDPDSRPNPSDALRSPKDREELLLLIREVYSRI